MEQKIIAQVESNRDSMIEDILKVVRIDSVESEALPCLLYTSSMIWQPIILNFIYWIHS